MLREIWYTLKDTLQSGDLVGHLRAFRRVLSGQVQPDDPAGSPTERHNPPAEACRAAPLGAAIPQPPFSPCSTPAGDAPGAAGGDPHFLAARIIDATPLIVIWPSGQAEVG
ncbi:MAG: hypothetical protein WC869_10525 [Phycisphaerae bacterium]|jgi:hypothetical protein